MLKKLIIALIIVCLCGCRPSDVIEINESYYSILSFKGSSSLCLLSITNEEYDIEITESVDKIVTNFEEGNKDIIIAPINTGIESSQLYNKYSLLSIVQYGTFHIYSSSEDCPGGLCGAIGKDTISGSLVSYLSETDLHRFSFIWYDTLDDLLNALYAKVIDCILLDEINYINLVDYQNMSLYEIEDIQEDIQYQTGYNSYPIYGMFVKNEIITNDQTNLVNFARMIKESIETNKSDKTSFNNQLVKANINKMGFDNIELISASYNYCGLDFVYAANELDSIKNILYICDIELNENVIVD